VFFFSCDWGTSSFRLRLVRRANGAVEGELRSEEGVARLARDQAPGKRAKAFERALDAHVRELSRRHGLQPGDIPVVVSGMASSSVGWRELPYAQVPFPVDGSGAVTAPVPFSTGRPPATLVSGLRTETEVMRGEEAQLIGLFSLPAWKGFAGDSLVLLPGTHSKHVVVRDGALTGFRTFMTGELFEVLATQSMLRHSVEYSPREGVRVCNAAFEAGVASAKDRPLSQALFQVRTNTLLGRFAPRENFWFFSGLLMGVESFDVARRGGDSPVVLCSPLAGVYERAFRQAGLGPRLKVVAPDEVEKLSVRGHAVILQRQQGAKP